MFEYVLNLFKKDKILAELKAGPVPALRAKGYIVAAMFLSFIGNSLSGVIRVQEKMKDGSATEAIIALVTMFVVVVLIFFVFRYLIGRLYEANGGASGKQFFERLFLLAMSAGTKFGFSIAAFMLIFLLVLWVTNFTYIMVAAFGLSMIVALFGGLIWMYLYVQSGLREIKAADGNV